MKKIIVSMIILFLILVSFRVGASEEWSDTWKFDYEEEVNETEPPVIPQYDPQAFETYDTLYFGGKLSSQQGSVFTLYDTLYFGGKLVVQEEPQEFTLYDTLYFGGKLSSQSGNLVVYTNPNPSDGEIDVLQETTLWNTTIKSPVGDLFNWSIETSPDVGANYSNYTTNGSKQTTISSLSYSTTYTVYVNGTTGINGTEKTNNTTFTFTIEDAPDEFEAYYTLYFGGQLEVEEGYYANVTVNYSDYVEETNATMYGFLIDNQTIDTTCWFEWHNITEDYTNPDGNESVGVIPEGQAFSLDATGLSNGTLYYFRARANNSNGWNSSVNSSYFLTKPQTPTSITFTEVGNDLNISWTHGNGYNKSALYQNHTSYPTDRTSEGTELVYLGTNNYYENSSMVVGETYYYRVWEYSEWTPLGLSQYSDGNESGFHTMEGGNPSQSNPNPSDGETDVLISTKQWNITVNSPHGEALNWSIESSCGSNSTSNDGNNGSKWMEIAGNLSFGTTFTVWVNTSLYNTDNWTNDSYTFTVESDDAPIMMNENPTNGTTDVLASVTTWNVTIHDIQGHTFNWSIEPSTGSGDSNSSTYSTNRSYNCSLTGLAESTTYTVWVNVTDTYSNISNNTFYYFTTHTPGFASYDILYFGGKLEVQGTDPVISSEAPSNESTGESLYPWLNITIDDPQTQTMNVTWYSNYSGEWQQLGYNSSCASGSTQRWRATWANTSSTTYYWNVSVNDTDGHYTNETYHFTTASYSWGNWSSWWQFNYSCCCPTSFTASTWNRTAINLTWVNCADGYDATVLVVNESGWSGYPINVSNGTELYNGTNQTYNHTNLYNSTTYYYTIWGWNNTEKNYSVANETDSATTQGAISVFSPFPTNNSFEVSIPPTNLSVSITGSNLEVYFYLINMSPETNTTSLIYNWTGVDTGRVVLTDIGFEETNATTAFIFGHTPYTWYVNVTDTVDWVNNTYYYQTINQTAGKDARMDVNGNGFINVQDVSYEIANYSPPYDDTIYDVNWNGLINVQDVSYVIANYT